jgi:hypothetical protein
LAVSFAVINRVSDEIETFLTQRGLVEDAVRINKCFGYRYCHSRFCIKCASRRVYRQRKHLLSALPALLSEDTRYQIWFITGAAADSADLNAAARSAVIGMQRLLKHDRLKRRVVAHFSVLEIAHKHGRKHPCAHVHTLVVTKPMNKGKYRISRKDWIEMWEEACPLHRKRVAKPRYPRRRRVTKTRRSKKTNAHESLVAKMIPRDERHILRVIRYCTKWANPRRVARDFRSLLNPDPNAFIHRMDTLKGVTRFFGGLHAGA